jgi:hypothetical protein
MMPSALTERPGWLIDRQIEKTPAIMPGKLPGNLQDLYSGYQGNKGKDDRLVRKVNDQ